MTCRLPLSWSKLGQVTCPFAPSSLVLADLTTAATFARRPDVARKLPITLRRGKRSGPGWSTLAKSHQWHNKYNQTLNLPDFTTGPAAALKRKEQSTPFRCGVLGTKKGMTAVYQYGKRIPCTVLQLDGVTVVANKTFEKHGYWAVQVGMGTRKAKNVASPMLGYYEAKGIRPMMHLAEFRVRSADGLLPVGVELWPDWFHKGQYVDARSTSRGMGFAGGMKRHGFAGQGKSHGNSLNHRTIGSVGPSQGSGSRVHPGKKMPGRMGGQRVTVQNLQILGVDNNLGTVLVKGALGGPKGSIVKIQDAIKKRPPYPSHMKEVRDALDKRFPHAAYNLYEARQLHMKLKKMRKDGNIMEAITESNKGVNEVEAKNRAAVAAVLARADSSVTPQLSARV